MKQPRLLRNDAVALLILLLQLYSFGIGAQQGSGSGTEQAEVVKMTLVLELDSAVENGDDGSHQVSRGGDFENWLCAFDAFVTAKIAPIDEDEGGGFLAQQAEWKYNLTQAVLTFEAISGQPAQNLWVEFQSILNVGEINDFMQINIPADPNSVLHGASLLEWEGVVDVSSTSTSTSTRNDYFSTDQCGIARVSLKFGFFNDTALYQGNDTAAWEADILNLLCIMDEYYSDTFSQMNQLYHGKTGNLNVILDRLYYEFNVEANQTMPLTIQFDLQASETDTGRRVPPFDMLSWIELSDFAHFIQHWVWTALPYERNIFYYANFVKYHGVVRYLDEPLPVQTNSTVQCVNGAYNSSNAEVSGGEKVTNWTMQYGFDLQNAAAGVVAREPTISEIFSLFCQTAFYYTDLLLMDSTDAYISPFHQRDSPFSNLTLELAGWSYDTAADNKLPLTVEYTARAWYHRGNRVQADVLLNKMLETNVEKYLQDFIWKIAPTEQDLFFYTEQVRYLGSVAAIDNDENMSLSSVMCTQAADQVSSTVSEAALSGMILSVGVPINQGSVINETTTGSLLTSANETSGDNLTVDTSFLVLHPRNVQVEKESTEKMIKDAVADMVQAMVVSLPSRSFGPQRHRHLLQVTLDVDSITISNATEADCSRYYEEEMMMSWHEVKACSQVYLQYQLNVTDETSPESIHQSMTKNTEEGIKLGYLQQSLDHLYPGSGLNLTSLSLEESTDQTDAYLISPELDNDVVSSSPLSSAPLVEAPQNIATTAPEEDGTSSPQPSIHSTSHAKGDPGLGFILATVLISLSVCIVALINAVYCCRRYGIPGASKDCSSEDDGCLLFKMASPAM